MKVGQTTIIEFLEKKGVKVENSPSSIIEPAVYAILDKEFGGNKNIEKVNIREKIALKHEAVSLGTRKGSDGASEEESGFKSEVFVKSGVISVKDEVAAMSTPKILGKIDLSGGRSGRLSSSEKKPESPKKPAAASEISASSVPAADVKPVEPSQPVRPPVAVAEQPAPSPRPEQPVTAPVVVQSQTYDERVAADQSNLFRPEEGARLSGPKVLGKIDVQSFEKKKGEDGHRRREKRKRITKDKVDITQKQNQTATARPDGRPKSQGGGPYSSQGGSQHGPKSGLRDRKKGKSVKPVVKTEISDEEVQKQIKDTLARLTSKGSKFKTAKHRRDKREAVSARLSEEMERQEQEKNVLKVTEFVTVSELATMMDVSVTDVITACMNLGLMVSINQRLDAEALVVVAEEFGFKVEFVAVEIQEAIDTEEDSEEDLVPRPPVVAVMGHVDHGKTSLLDALRETNVAAKEAGGITQHIGAYQITLGDGQKITFIDTPGHEAFSEMRARGAKVTDIVVLVVAANDGIMPQTVEAIRHAQAAEVPIVVAINKIDLPGADPLKVKTALLQHGIAVEEMGGESLCAEVSAKKRINIDKLVEAILLQAEILDLKADPTCKASGTVIEAKMEKGRGSVATLLVQKGTLKVGDIIIAGKEWGHVRAMFNEHGHKIFEAGPATPVEVIGLQGTPAAGDNFNMVESESQAKEITNYRIQKERDAKLVKSAKSAMEQMLDKIKSGESKHLPVIIKADVQGSVEAIEGTLNKLSNNEVSVQILHSAVGPISESDITLAKASNALIIGFNVRAIPQARDMARRDGVDIRYYSIIYDVADDVKKGLEGLLSPELREKLLGYAEIRNVFNITGVGRVAGCMVTEGMVKRGAKVRLLRDNVVIHDGSLGQLKRFKDDVKEVKEGYECGMSFENYNDIQVGDFIECYEIETIAAKLA